MMLSLDPKADKHRKNGSGNGSGRSGAYPENNWHPSARTLEVHSYGHEAHGGFPGSPKIEQVTKA